MQAPNLLLRTTQIKYCLIPLSFGSSLMYIFLISAHVILMALLFFSLLGQSSQRKTKINSKDTGVVFSIRKLFGTEYF